MHNFWCAMLVNVAWNGKHGAIINLFVDYSHLAMIDEHLK